MVTGKNQGECQERVTSLYMAVRGSLGNSSTQPRDPLRTFPHQTKRYLQRTIQTSIQKTENVLGSLNPEPPRVPHIPAIKGSTALSPPAHSAAPQTSICWLWVIAPVSFTIQERDMLTEGPTRTVQSSGKQHHAPDLTQCLWDQEKWTLFSGPLIDLSCDFKPVSP